MSVADKQLFYSKVASLLEDKLTATQMVSVMQAISETSAEYEITYTNRSTDGGMSSDLIEAFISAKTIEGRSGKTINHYKYLIDKLIKSVNVPVEKINVYHIRKYLLSEKTRGVSDSTIEGYRTVYSSFFGWLHKEGLIQTNPCANIGTIHCEKKVRKPFSDIDIEKIKESCGTDRNRAIFFFLLSTGCRVSEACGLNRDDINFQTLECKVLGKGNKERTVYISNVAAMMLKRYLENRRDNSKALFVGKGSDRLTPAGVRFMFKKVAKAAGVENVHPHRCRRTLATSLINHGMSLQDVAHVLGHDKLDTTMKYVYMDQQNVKNAYRKFAS